MSEQNLSYVLAVHHVCEYAFDDDFLRAEELLHFLFLLSRQVLPETKVGLTKDCLKESSAAIVVVAQTLL